MKKLLLLLIFVFVLPCAWAQDFTNTSDSIQSIEDRSHRTYLKIAAWNIRIFSKNRTDEELAQICKVAKNFDFIAVVELRDEEVLKRMVEMMAKNHRKRFAYEISEKVGNVGGGHTELYAFLYNTSFIKVVTPGKIYNTPNMFRKPYYATFKADQFDFTVIATHVIWGDKVSQRREEINRLADIYTAVQRKDPNEQDIILLGDFNRNPEDDLAWGPMKSKTGMTHLFSSPEKSMIWDSHLYDNIWFQSHYTTEYTLDRGIIHFDEEDFGNDDKAASKAVSDHRPVWGKFRITGPDDD